MKTIYKFGLQSVDRQVILLTENAPILSVGLDPQGQLSCWAFVETSEPMTFCRTIIIIGTGHLVPEDVGPFLGTVNDHPFMWHIFEGN